MIDPRYTSWDELLLAAADGVIADAGRGGARLAGYTWGQYNTTRIQHPLSLAVPRLASWLDMPARALAGDWDNMPRIQTPTAGASQRMGVSPGRESDGYLHMPCGQSGIPCRPTTAMLTRPGRPVSRVRSFRARRYTNSCSNPKADRRFTLRLAEISCLSGRARRCGVPFRSTGDRDLAPAPSACPSSSPARAPIRLRPLVAELLAAASAPATSYIVRAR